MTVDEPKLRQSKGFLDDKRILVTGVLTNKSIAYGIAAACRRQGAQLAFTYQDERMVKRVRKVAEQFESALCFPCDVRSDEQIRSVFDGIGSEWGRLDGVVHSIGFAPPEAISGSFLDGLSREAFHLAHEVSSYSFPALAKAALPLLNPRGSLLTLSYIGAARVMPGYNTMGLAKASLEASVRYLAADLGPKGMRANAISAAVLPTIASSGLGAIDLLLENQKKRALVDRDMTIDDIGNVAAFLLSDLSGGINGQVIYVDGGFSSNG
ncbi:MAG: enoyl-ACP reductase [Nevskia sp.]|nr:enoyl-ACP reductase [Nevskia sp.]